MVKFFPDLHNSFIMFIMLWIPLLLMSNAEITINNYFTFKFINRKLNINPDKKINGLTFMIIT